MKIQITKHDKEWSRLVRERDDYTCQVCKKRSDWVHAHHFVRRGIKPTRLDVNNGITLCAQCHTFNHTFSAHKTPEAFKKWFRSNNRTRAKILEDKAKQTMNDWEMKRQFLKDYCSQSDSPLYKDYVKTFVTTSDGLGEMFSDEFPLGQTRLPRNISYSSPE